MGGFSRREWLAPATWATACIQAGGRNSMFGRCRVLRRCGVFVMRAGGGVMRFVELLGALWAFEFMALAGNGKQGNGHKQDRK